MTIEEAIKTALEYEENVYNLYRENLDKIKDPAGRRVFETLAKEERSHLDFLEMLKKRRAEGGSMNVKRLETTIPSPEKIMAGVEALEEISAIEPKDTETILLRKALELERETGEFYNRMVGELEEEGKKIFARFVEIEEGHLAIVQAELDYLSGSGFWFDFQEIVLG